MKNEPRYLGSCGVLKVPLQFAFYNLQFSICNYATQPGSAVVVWPFISAALHRREKRHLIAVVQHIAAPLIFNPDGHEC